MKFSVTGMSTDEVVSKRVIEASTKHEIELYKLSYGFVSIINVKQLNQ